MAGKDLDLIKLQTELKSQPAICDEWQVRYNEAKQAWDQAITDQDFSAQYDASRKTSQAAGMLNVEKQKLDYLRKQAGLESVAKELEAARLKQIEILRNDIKYISKKPGDRILTWQTFDFITSAISIAGYSEQLKNRIVNEIVYAIRFGDLVTDKQTGKPLAIANAAKIAIWMVKNDRWVAPEGLFDDKIAGVIS